MQHDAVDNSCGGDIHGHDVQARFVSALSPSSSDAPDRIVAEVGYDLEDTVRLEPTERQALALMGA